MRQTMNSASRVVRKRQAGIRCCAGSGGGLKPPQEAAAKGITHCRDRQRDSGSKAEENPLANTWRFCSMGQGCLQDYRS